MIIIISSPERELASAGYDVVRLFYPEAIICFEPRDNFALLLNVSVLNGIYPVTVRVNLTAGTGAFSETVPAGQSPFPNDQRNQRKRLVKLAVLRVLARYTGIPPGPWGILTGIRPTKIVHRLFDLGWISPEVIAYLVESYDMCPGKAALLTEIAGRQRQFLLPADEVKHMVSIYIGIPFCPSRCAYCSFPAYSVEAGGGVPEPFLEALKKEVREIGKVLADLGKKIQTVYIGGGTPTVLGCLQLRGLLETVKAELVSESTAEITLEAGRPDTITAEKLIMALELGVTRLSINPRSMNRHTLERIGRGHPPDMVAEAMGTARKAGFTNINMDIILGLPGEGIEDVRNTLSGVAPFSPENLTVHTLAVKRASKLKESGEGFALASAEQVNRMHHSAAEAAAEMGMHPYYLYRQKKMVSPLENIGYAREGFDCIYNVQMIEERQTVIGLGGGAGSKFVEPGDWYLTSLYNPKDPQTYIERIDELIANKVDKLRSFG